MGTSSHSLRDLRAYAEITKERHIPERIMQAPTILIDHVNKTTKTIQGGGTQTSSELLSMLTAQKGQVSASGPTPAK